MRSMLENLLAERRSRRSDRARVVADAVDRPARIAAVGGRHVFGDRRMFAIAADAQMRGDPLAFEENLDRPGGHPDVHLGAGEAIGNAVIVRAGVDVIIDADPTDAPFAKDIGLGRQDLSAGRWIASSNCGRVTPSLRMGRSSFRCLSNSPMASLTSARLMKMR